MNSSLSITQHTARGGAALLLISALWATSGCATTPHRAPPDLSGFDAPRDVRAFDGRTGAPLPWAALMNRVASADITVVGEQHDDARGHRTQLAILTELSERAPACALSMEMLDRSEQSVADDYLSELIDRDAFLERTASTPWRKLAMRYLDGDLKRRDFERRITALGWPDWEHNYQPMIDLAKERGFRVVAANTPWLVYMSLAGREGYDRLDSLTDVQRALFDQPLVADAGSYRSRFWNVMTGRDEGEADARNEDGSAHPGMSDEQVARMFRSHRVTDATMGASAANALHDGASHVLHLVGQFHSDFDGGTVQEIRHRAPDARVLTISLQPRTASALDDVDNERADVVIYTGQRE